MTVPDRSPQAMAAFLAGIAGQRKTITYGEFGSVFGLPARSCGSFLNKVAEYLRDLGLPLLSVLVVNKATGRPAEGAQIYMSLGIENAEDMDAEIQRCFDKDWSEAPFTR